jgi:hypothetical protein
MRENGNGEDNPKEGKEVEDDDCNNGMGDEE